MDADAIFLYPKLHRTTTKDCGFFCFVLALQGHYFVWQWLYCILYYVFGAMFEMSKLKRLLANRILYRIVHIRLKEQYINLIVIEK